MGYHDALGWFPFQTMALRDDLVPAGEVGRVLTIVAQWPESKDSWPYTFRGCHPVKQWRRPNADELEKARKFYGLNDKVNHE